jgi:thiol-disulfide isomerase/thioredoxin
MNGQPGRAGRAAGAALLVATAAWAGFRLYAGRTPARATADSARVAAAAGALRVPVGEASPPSAGDLSSADIVIPDRLPTFTLSDRNGKATPIAAWRGKSLVINFWATWCAPCRREIPLLESLYTEWAGRNVEVVGIAVDYREKVAAFANQLKIPYPLLVGEQDALDVAGQFGVDSPVFPFTVFTDQRGEVVALYVGELHRPQADLILGVVRKLDADQVELPEARRSIAAGLEALLPDHPG